VETEVKREKKGGEKRERLVGVKLKVITPHTLSWKEKDAEINLTISKKLVVYRWKPSHA
jgi:hypothetical protein